MFVKANRIYGKESQGKAKANLRYISRAYSKHFEKEFGGESFLYDQTGVKLLRSDIDQIQNSFSEDPSSQFFKLIVSPDPKVDYSKTELHSIANRTISKVRSLLSNDIDSVYAIHEDTDSPHIHFLLWGERVNINIDRLNDLKTSLKDHEQDLVMFKGIDTNRYRSFNPNPAILQLLSGLRGNLLKSSFKNSTGTKNLIQFQKELDLKHQKIKESVFSLPIYDIKKMPLEKGFAKEFTFNIPFNRFNLDQGKVAELISSSFGDFLKQTGKDLVPHVHVDTVDGFHNAVGSLKSKKDIALQDFTLNEIALLKDIFRSKLTDLAIDKHDRENMVSAHKSAHYLRLVNANMPGPMSFFANSAILNINHQIRRKQLLDILKSSSKFELVEASGSQRVYNLSLGNIFHDGKPLLKDKIDPLYVQPLMDKIKSAIEVDLYTDSKKNLKVLGISQKDGGFVIRIDNFEKAHSDHYSDLTDHLRFNHRKAVQDILFNHRKKELEQKLSLSLLNQNVGNLVKAALSHNPILAHVFSTANTLKTFVPLFKNAIAKLNHRHLVNQNPDQMKGFLETAANEFTHNTQVTFDKLNLDSKSLVADAASFTPHSKAFKIATALISKAIEAMSSHKEKERQVDQEHEREL